MSFSPFISFLSRSLARKLVLVFLFVAIVPLIISSFVSYQTTYNTLSNEYIDSNLKVIQQGSLNIQNYLEQFNQLSLTPYKDSEFMFSLIVDKTEFLRNSYNENFLKNILFSRDDIIYLYFYTISNTTLYSLSKQQSAKHVFPSIENEPWFKKTIESENGFYLTPTHPFKNYRNIGSSKNDLVFTVNRTLKDVINNQIMGVLSINISIQPLARMCDSLRNKKETIIFLDNQSQLIYSNHPKFAIKKELLHHEIIRQKTLGYYFAKIDGEKYAIIFSRTFHDFVLIKAIPYHLLIQSAGKPVKIILFVGMITLLFMVAAAVFISYRITFPIKRLVNNMNKLGEGNFDVAITSHGTDEIGQLTQKFNEMALEISHLINSEYKAKIVAKDAQLRALQAQINPHFLNNALQSLGTLALRKKAPEVYSMALAIASMLRYSLLATSDLVPLQTEIEYTKNYLSIQKIRFGDRLEYQFDLDPTLMEYRVPRLILQPFVENSTKYGLDESQDMEQIFISGRIENESLILAIKDTGRGIEPQRLAKIQRWLGEPNSFSSQEHLGLQNVVARLWLIYGDKALLNISSELGLGTVIALKIPANKGSD